MKLIEKIEIKYFRSFSDKSVKIVSLQDLNIFSGSNDVGKSNVLKALNLFFNDEIIIGEKFSLEKDLSFLQAQRSMEKVRSKKKKRTEDDPYVSQRDLFVSVKIHFNRHIDHSNSTTPVRFWVQKKWDKNGLALQNSNIETAYKKKNKRPPTQPQAAALQGQLTQFLNSIYFEYIPAVKDRKFLKHLFNKLQASLFDRDKSFKGTSVRLNEKITTITSDLFEEFKAKTDIGATFEIPETLLDFFSTISVSTENGVSLYSRGDGIQARFIPAILNEISKGKKHVLWGFEEPENSYEYRAAEQLAKDFQNEYSKKKQIFITSHTKEFLSLIKGNEKKVSLYRVYKTLENGSLIDVYKEKKGFDKQAIKVQILGGEDESSLTPHTKDILNKIFEDIGFLETDQYLIEDLQNQLKEQRQILDKSSLGIEQQDKIIQSLNNKIKKAIMNKDQLEKEIEEYKKPILYVEDKYDQIYKIAYLKTNDIDCDKNNLDTQFQENSTFLIRRSEGTGPLAGRLRVPNNDGYEDKKIIGLFDFDKEGRENFYHLKDHSFWEDDIKGDMETGYHRKRNDHPCFYAMLLPVPEALKDLANLEWDNFLSYVEVENLLPLEFLQSSTFVEERPRPGGTYFKFKKDKKDKLWKKLFDLPVDDFKYFTPLFDEIDELFGVDDDKTLRECGTLF